MRGPARASTRCSRISTTRGAFVASPDFSQYGYCWLRDASFVAVALDRVGEHDAAARYHRWVGRTIGGAGIGPLIEAATENQLHGRPIVPSELPPARFSLEGVHVADDWPNFQLDGYGTWLWSVDAHVQACGRDELLAELRPGIARTARYLSAFAFEPCFDVWEETRRRDPHVDPCECLCGAACSRLATA